MLRAIFCMVLTLSFWGQTIAQFNIPKWIYSSHIRKAPDKNFPIKNFLPNSKYGLPDFTNEIINSSENKVRIDSIIATSIYGGGSKFTFQYNKGGKLSEELWQSSTGTGWYNNTITNYSYNVNDNLLSIIELSWDSGKWDSSSRSLYNYDLNGVLISSIFQTYSGNNWVNSSKDLYKYSNAKEPIDTAIDQSWLNNSWQNNMMTKYFYSSRNTKDSIYFDTWNGTGWQKNLKTIFYYNNSQTGLDSIVSKFWGGNWLNSFKQIIINDSNNNEIEQIDQNASGIWWQNSERRFYTYNQSNALTSAYSEVWNNSAWVPGDGTFFISDSSGIKFGIIANKINLYYSNITDVKDKNIPAVNNFYLPQNYPNPFNPTTTINFSIPRQEFVSIEVYNILGKQIAVLVNEERPAGSYQVQFNANGLASGVYIYKIRAGEYSKSKLMILEK